MKAPKTQKVKITRAVRLAKDEKDTVREYTIGSVVELSYSQARELVANGKAVETTEAVGDAKPSKPSKPSKE